MPSRSLRSREALKEGEQVTETERVHVSIRVRPLNKRERTSKRPICLEADHAANQLSIKETVRLEMGEVSPFSEEPTTKTAKMTFQFDSIFWSLKSSGDNQELLPATQEDIFSRIGIPLVNHAFRGFNSCLFAYGQTGSGKTYTMMGEDLTSLEESESRGVAPRIFQEIFDRKTQMEAEVGNVSTWSVEIGYVEIYNERVSDLLAKRPKSGEEVFLEVREHPNRGIFLEGQRLVHAKSFNDIIKCVEEGNAFRHTASTKMNNRSSRSHAIIMIVLREERLMTTKNQTAIRTAGKSSRMNLVDLAGSERVTQSEVEGTRFTEATHINLSLTTLGRVIDILADMATKGSKTRYTTAPFRDAKLTFILKDSLGGNSKTMMIAAVSPSGLNYDETLGTLRYASRARDIINVAKVNEDPRARRIRQLEEEMATMKRALAVADPTYVAQLEEKIALIESEAQNRAADLQALEKEREANQLRERMLKATEAERAELERQSNLLKKQVEDSRRQAMEMQEQNARLKEEQAQREQKLLEDVERVRADIRIKEQTLERTKLELERERTERENAVKFIQHYKEKLESALFHSERSAAERMALEQVNTTLNLKLKELEEEQAQYVNGLVKKLEDCEKRAALSRAQFAVQIAESDMRYMMAVVHAIRRESIFQDYHAAALRCAGAPRKRRSLGKGLLKEDFETLSTGGITRSSPAVSESASDGHRGVIVHSLRGQANVLTGRSSLASAEERQLQRQDGSLTPQHRHADPTQESHSAGPVPSALDVPQALKKVDQAAEDYYQYVDMIKSHAEVLQRTQQDLEDLIERFFTESVSVETQEETMAARLSDMELAKEAFETKESELQMLNERLEECAQQREMAIRHLEHQIEMMLKGKFEVRLLFPGDRDEDSAQERDLRTREFQSPTDDLSLNTAKDTDEPKSLPPKTSLQPQESGDSSTSFDLSAIKRSILDTFPVSAHMASFLGKAIQ